MSDLWALPLKQLDLELSRLPAVVTWSRLEPMSLSSDLTPALQALVADPLWAIGRQWQFGELRGEDGGSPVASTLSVEHAPLSRLRLGGTGAPDVELLDESIPLEARVEAEAPTGVAVPERIRAEGGLQLLRLLAAAGLAAGRQAVVARWAFPSAGTIDPALPDVRGTQRADVYAGRVPDAARVEADIDDLAGEPGAPLTALPDGLTFAGGAAARTAARGVLGTWLQWYRGYLVRPVAATSAAAASTATPPAWNPSRQEYSFAVQAGLDAAPVVLAAPEYTSGRLDWTDFETVTGAIGDTPPTRRSTTTHAAQLPVGATFPGMPADRLWEFEDSRVHLAALEVAPTDLTRMALVEFAVAYGVDWFVLPVEVPAGSVLRVADLEVVDSFGVRVTVGPARRRGHWSMFDLATAATARAGGDLFVVPPVVHHVVEGDPLEEVALFRDEMANLVWGVERVVQAPSGEPVSRSRAAAPVTLRQQLPGDLGDAAIVYRLMSPVPDHWVPFVAVRRGTAGTIELERRPLLHFRDDGTVDTTHPRGMLLRVDPAASPGRDRLRLVEEEVPSDGAVVTRRLQLTRGPDGTSALWIGRRKRTGEGEGWSGLRFDTALAPEA